MIDIQDNAPIMFQGMSGRRFTISFENRLISYDANDESWMNLEFVRHYIEAAFGPALRDA